MRVAIVGLPHCVQTLHILKWDTRTEGHTGPNESPVFPKQPQQIFSVSLVFSVSCLNTLTIVTPKV